MLKLLKKVLKTLETNPGTNNVKAKSHIVVNQQSWAATTQT